MPCSFHPDRPEEYTCERCSAPLCHDCGVDILGHVYCLRCKEDVLRAYERGEAAAADGGRGPTPFERRREIGFVRGLTETLRESLFRPQEFFGRIEPEENLGDAVLYGVIVGSVPGVLGLVWQLAFGNVIERISPVEVRDAGSAPIERMVMIVMLFAMPLTVLIGGFVMSAVYHLALLLLGGARRGFSATARSVFYGYGGNIWSAIPFCGWPVATVWTLVITIIGMAKLHETAFWKAILAYFLPPLVCACGFLAILTAVLRLSH